MPTAHVGCDRWDMDDEKRAGCYSWQFVQQLASTFISHRHSAKYSTACPARVPNATLSFAAWTRAIQAGDSDSRLQSCRWVMHKIVDEPYFFSRLLWIDEAGFTRSGITNQHHLHEWTLENPHATRQSTFQHRVSVNVKAGVINKYLIVSYITEHIGGDRYTRFLEATFPLFSGGCPHGYSRKNVFPAWRCTSPFHTPRVPFDAH
jgi:hypothetical protein